MYTLLTTTRKLTLSAYKHETNVEERRDRSLAKIKVTYTKDMNYDREKKRNVQGPQNL